jgi:hypothetical protein
MSGRFIRIHNRMVHLDSIAYVDFLDSGRAMIFMSGLTQEKQNIAVDPDETLRLKAILEAEMAEVPAIPQVSPSKFPENRRWS